MTYLLTYIVPIFTKVESMCPLLMYLCLGVTEAHRALELLEDYHSKLIKPQDRQLRLAIERVIRIFKSRLFQALLGEFIELS